ncbi:MAG: HRDC domain-containing protein [Acidobacteria bacterium]|nr:HRDC domain-containing protein [Candidatus Sulfomarinibacter sp. MAG AM2]
MSDNFRPAWIDTAEGVREAAELCAANGSFALDTEADSMHSYFHKVCLIQVTAAGRHLVIDPLALEPSDLAPLWSVVGDPSIPVLMHGADYDVRILDRDYGARVHGLRDTQIMAQLLGEEKTGLAALLDKELDVRLDKRYQRADWGRRPLKAAQLAYAAADTAYLGDLTDRLRSRLEELGRWGWAEEEYRTLEGVRHAAATPDPVAFERLKGARALRGADRDRLYSLHRWRDREARAFDVPPFKILGNRQLMLLAQEPPADLGELGKIEGIGPRAVRRWGRELLRRLDRPQRAPERAPIPRAVKVEPVVRQRIKRLLGARDAKSLELGLQGGLLCPRGCVDAVATRAPVCSTVDDLADAGLNGWRLEVLADDFLAALDDG